ncbi:hypothetical protein FSP39_007957 [Pinctada imbricata]|uniref:carbonyl reductase (NADPH) n=1 Tax=Pinctada imbricata TaxID=66713 RepID=A0AA89C546_PINIB|nr:hypothetical protein FSP39_007957 [Pinctada imbricata]
MVLPIARNEDLGHQAVMALSDEGLRRKPQFHQLDITDKASIERLRAFLKSKYGGLDVLINNAGIAFKQDTTAPFSEQAEVSIRTNYTGTLDVCTALFPLLRPHARVVNVSSLGSRMSIKKCSPEVKAKFTAPDVTIEQCTSYLDDFIAATKQGNHEKQGYSNSAYGMSKVGVSVMSMIQAREMNKDSREDIVINACCPGYVDTDMTSHKGRKIIDQGADTPLYLGLLPPGTKNPKGCFVSDRNVVDWTQ